MNEQKLKHLDLIQAVVNRMGSNSFKLKGWCVTLVTGVLFFSSAVSEEKENLMWIALMPVFVFWILDGYFLWQERIFRRTYDIVRQKSEADITFKMFESSDEKLYWTDAIFSTTLLVFYIGLIGAILLLKFCVIYP